MYKFLSLFLLLPFFLNAISLDDLSLEEKVGQMLIVHFHGSIANEDSTLLSQRAHAGGFIYYNWANSLDNPDQVKKLSESLQLSTSKISLFIMVDQEGGRVQRLKNGFTLIPSALEIAIHLSPNEAEELAYKVGKELKQAGINMNLAPVVDVNVNPKNPIIGNRSFGESPEVVSVFAKSMLKGYQRAGIIPILKHFPGHGDVTVDSHIALPVVDKSIEDLTRAELKPYRELSQITEAIMTAHILVPAFDPNFPATTSKKILNTLLREELGFQGVIISDSLAMQGILSQYPSIDEAAIAAIQAGCDLLILGGKQLNGEDQLELQPQDILRIQGSIVRAVQQGIISKDRIDESVRRILNLKETIHD